GRRRPRPAEGLPEARRGRRGKAGGAQPSSEAPEDHRRAQARRSGRLIAPGLGPVALGALVLGACSAVVPPQDTAPRPAAAAVVAVAAGVVPGLFVAASAPPGGDGSRARPFRALADAPGRGRLRLAAGLYPAGVVLEGVELLGGPAVVLAGTPPAPCL